MQSGSTRRPTVSTGTGWVKQYVRQYAKFLQAYKSRAHRRRVKQDLANYDEDTFDDHPQDSSETFTAWDVI